MEQYEVNWKDCYKVLGVNPDAEPEVIKAAYTALARKHHPDAGGNGARMKDVNEAYEVLSDAAKKSRYDACYRRRHTSSGQRSNETGQERPHAHGESGYGPPPGGQRRQEQTYSQGQANPRPPPGPSRTAGPTVLPWPSMKWQRIALFLTFPLALAVIFLTHNPWAIAAGIALLLMAAYAAIKTRGLRVTTAHSLRLRLACATPIAASLCFYGAAAVALALALAALGGIILAGMLLLKLLHL